MLRHPETEEWLSSFKPGTKVTWCEYWDDTYVAYWLEPSGTSAGGVLGGSRWVLHPTKHDYGFFPIVIDGPWRNPLQDADKMYPSIYFAIRSPWNMKAASLPTWRTCSASWAGPRS